MIQPLCSFLTALLSFSLVVPASLLAAFDSSDYRTNTYGAPTHYCDLTLSIAAPSGSGTIGDPWNATRCMTQPVAGNRVGILPTGSSAVTLTAPASTQNAAFKPTNSGTLGNPIIYVTKYAAVAMDRSTITSNANRTQWKHAGTGDQVFPTCGGGTGGPVLGVNGQSYIWYDGFFIDASQAHFINDSGVVHLRDGTGNKIENFAIKGEVTTCTSNCIYIRTENQNSATYKNGSIFGYDNQPPAGCTPPLQNGFAIMQYGDQNFTAENLFIDAGGADEGWFFKGTSVGGTVFNYGQIRYNLIQNVLSCWRTNDYDTVNTTTIHHNLCSNWTDFGFSFSTVTSIQRNVNFHHNTIAKGCVSTGGCTGALYFTFEAGTPTNVTMQDNLYDINNDGTSQFEGAGDVTAYNMTSMTIDYNGLYAAGGNGRWSFNGLPYTSLASWKAAAGVSGIYAHITGLLGSDPFNNRAANDFTIAAGHAALTGSSTGGQLGAYEGGATVGIDIGGAPLGSGPVMYPRLYIRR